MKKTITALAVAALLGAMAAPSRRRTFDTAFLYRMGAGFPGDVNRTHPASIIPGLNDATNPVPYYGFPIVLDTTNDTYRGVLATDDSITTIYGVAARPFPTQQTVNGMNATYGVAVPPTGAPLDAVRQGLVMVQLSDFAANPSVKGGAVYVWTAASTGNHVLGGFEAAATPGSTAGPITNASFNSPPDSNGVAEIEVWAALYTAP